MEGRLRQPPLTAPVIPFAGHQAISQQATQQTIVPGARIVFLVVVEHAPNVVRVIEEVDERGPDAGAEHIAEPLARPKLIAERVAQEFLEEAIRERNPLRNPRSRRHAHALHLSRRTIRSDAGAAPATSTLQGTGMAAPVICSGWFGPNSFWA